MTNKILLPHKFKTPGWIILVPSTFIGLFITLTDYQFPWLDANVIMPVSDDLTGQVWFFDTNHVNLTNTILGSLFIIGALMVSFSKEKKEDEFIANIRMSSLLWSVWVNYILLLAAFVTVYGTAFFTVMIYNMFTVLIIFIIRFHVILFKNAKLAADEK